MILKLQSDNPHFLDLLFKNPNTDFGLYCKPLREGQIIGNAIDANSYEVVFQDNRHSYNPDESNALDYQSFVAPIATLGVLNELFAHLLKSRDEFSSKSIVWLEKTQGEIDTFPCTIEIPSFFIDSNWYRDGAFLLTKYFSDIAVEQQTQTVFRLMITAKSVFDAVNLLFVTALFTHVTNNKAIFTYIDEALIEKYGRVLTNLENVPYFVFYLFILRTIRSPKQFEILKPVFEKYLAQYGLHTNLILESVGRLRQMFILERIEDNIAVLDIGCGELLYYKKAMDKGFKANYYAVDKNDEYEQLAETIARRYEADNITFFDDLAKFQSNEKLNILLTEVIEHNSLYDAKMLIKSALQYNFNKIFITTPNVEFNRYFQMERELRHEDHQFELTGAEFQTLINECIADRNVGVEYFALGDTINEIQPVQGVIIYNKN